MRHRVLGAPCPALDHQARRAGFDIECRRNVPVGGNGANAASISSDYSQVVNGAPVATSIVTMLGEAQIDEANEMSAQIAAARDAAIAKMIAGQSSKGS